MTTTELKYGMVEMITQVEDKASAEALFKVISEFIAEKLGVSDFEDFMSDGQTADLEASIAESFDQNNLVAHDEITRKHARWLQM